MTQQDNSHLQIEDRGTTLIVRVDGGPHSLFGVDTANELEYFKAGGILQYVLRHLAGGAVH